MSGINIVYCDMNDCSDAVAVDMRHIHAMHQLVVSDVNLLAVNISRNALTRDFFDIAYAGSIDFFTVCCLQALSDRMGRCILCKGCVF